MGLLDRLFGNGVDAFCDALDFVGDQFRKSTYHMEMGSGYNYDTEYSKAYAKFSTESDKELLDEMDYYDDPRDIGYAPEYDALQAVLKKRGMKK